MARRKIAGATALVTGASSGIGRETAIYFAKAGYNLIINYLDSFTLAKSLHEELIQKNCNVRIFKADVTKRDEVDAMIDFCIDVFGKVDVLINNAGILIFDK